MRFKVFLKALLFMLLPALLLTATARAESTVGADGSFSYSVPIAVPPGIKDMQPQLSLLYNSRGGNGILGAGWALAGIPTISRDARYPVNFDATDHYTFMGQKLTKDASGYYHTEIESFSRIQAFGLNGSTSYWTVSQPNGVKMTFGYEANLTSRSGHINAVGQGGKALIWSLSKVEDTNGNYYTISYLRDDATGAYYPDEIKYTQGNGPYRFKTVTFDYENRPDTITQYMPTKMEITKRLANIYVKVNGYPFNHYRLNYMQDSATGSSLLQSVQIFGTDDRTGNPPLTFAYTQKAGNLQLVQPGIGQAGDPYQEWLRSDKGATIIPGDFNGDGRTDFIRQENGEWAKDNQNTFQIYYSNGTADFRIVSPSGDNFQGYLKGEADNDGVNLIVGDFNGDGKADFLRQEKNNWASDTTNSFDVYLSQGEPPASTPNAEPFQRIEPGSNAAGDPYQDWLRANKSYDSTLNEDIATKLLVGDFNGDGKHDFVALRPNQWVKIYYSQGNGTFRTYDITSQLKGTIGNAAGIADAMVGDYDGDGKSDLLYFSDRADGAGSVRFTPYWGLFGDEGALSRTVALPQNPVAFAQNASQLKPLSTNSLEYALGDFNGDGRADVVQNIPYSAGGPVEPTDGMSLTSKDNHFFRTYFSMYNGYETKDYQPIQNCASNNTYCNGPTSLMQVGDFNGDGKSDLIDRSVLDIERVNRKYYSGDTLLFEFPDISTWQKYFNYNVLLSSTGDGSFSPLKLGDQLDTMDYGTYYQRMILGDLDGDGTTDFIKQRQKSDGSLNNWSNTTFDDGNNNNVALGFSGSLRSGLLQSIDNGFGGTTEISYQSLYQSGAVTASYSAPPASSTEAVADAIPRLLVNQITYKDGQGNAYADQYTFRDGLIHMGQSKDMKWLGFGSVTQTDALGGQTTTLYHQSGALAGRAYSTKSYSYNRDTGALVLNAETKNEYSVESTLAGVNKVLLTEVATKYYDPASGSLTDQTRMLYPAYDSYGNPLQRINMGSVNDADDDYQTDYTYTYNASSYLSFPEKQTVRAYNPTTQTAGAVQSSTRIGYDEPRNGALVSRGNATTIWSCTATAVYNGKEDCSSWQTSEKRTYDVNGNVTMVTDANNHSTIMTFDAPYKTSVIRTSNALQQVTTMAYDELGRPISATDSNGQTVTTEYDALSRKTKIITPDTDAEHPAQAFTYENMQDNGRTLTCAVVWEHPDVSTRQIEDGIVQYTANSVQSSCVDGMGRKIQSKTRTGEGQYTTVDTSYTSDAQNHTHLTQTSMPYNTTTLAPTVRLTSGSMTTEKQYFSSQGAVTEQIAPDGTTAKIIEVSPFLKLDYHAGSSEPDTKTHVDGQNRVVKVEESSSYTTFEYKPGTTLQTRMSQYGNDGVLLSSSSTEYNLLGLRTNQNDADLGHWTYTYDTVGRLQTSTDAKGQTASYTYDALNRITEAVFPDTTTSYYYDQNDPNINWDANIGQLTKVVYNNGQGQDLYNYDKMGRIASAARTLQVNGAPVTQTMSYSYDTAGRVQTITYPDGEQVSNAYQDGRLQSVAGANSYVSNIAYTDWGAVSQIGYGNGTTVNYGYKEPAQNKGNSYLLDSISVSGGNVALNQSYAYDGKYRLTGITDHINSQFSQSFAYDDSNRLTQDVSPALNQGQQNFTYNPTGGMNAMDNRSYAYNDASHPHAVTDDGKFSYTYDANGNMLTRTRLPQPSLDGSGAGSSDGPAASWSLNETGGTTAADKAGSSPLTLVGGVTFTKGLSGNGLLFDRMYDDDQAIGTVTDALPTGNSPYTISLWFKADPKVIEASNQQFGLLYWGTYLPYQINDIHLTNKAIVHSWYGSDLTYTPPGGVQPNAWYHVAATYDGVKRKLYVNGVKVSEDQPAANLHNVGASTLRLGNLNRAFSGMMDETSVYKRALSDAEVQALSLPKSPLLAGSESFGGSSSAEPAYQNRGPLDLDYTNGFTWEGWVTFDDLSPGRKWLFESSNGTDKEYVSVLYDGYDSYGDLFLAYGPSWSQESYIMAPQILEKNKKMHLMITLEKDPNHQGQYIGKIYKNGVLAAQKNALPAIATMTRTSTLLGKSNYNDMLFDGQMSNVNIYTRALTIKDLNPIRQPLLAGSQNFSGASSADPGYGDVGPQTLDFSDGFTWEGWVTYDGSRLQNGVRGYLAELIGPTNHDYVSVLGIGHGGTGDLSLRYSYDNGQAEAALTAPGILKPGERMHLAITVSPHPDNPASHIGRIYKNGVLVAEQTWLPAMTHTAWREGYVGRPVLDASNLFKGQMSEVNLYTQALSAGEIALHTQNQLVSDTRNFAATTNTDPAYQDLGTTSYSFDNGFTWEGWVYYDASRLQAGSREYLAEFADDFAPYNYFSILDTGLGGTGHLSLRYAQGGAEHVVEAQNILQTSSWMHLAITLTPDPAYPGQYIGRIYKNGIMVAEKAGLPAIVSGTRGHGYVGRPVMNSSNLFKGKMKDVNLYPNALSLETVQNHYDMGAADQRSFAYDSQNRLIRVTDTTDGISEVVATYAYDPSGQRIMTTAGTRTTYYWFPQYQQTYNGNQLTATDSYYFGISYTPVAWRNNGTLYYLYTDHQGSVVRVADASGHQVGAVHYTPYGEMADATGMLPELRYTGQIWDDATGLYYYNARYYDPQLGTFITADTASLGADMNRYMYVNGTPNMSTDPSGHNPMLPFLIFGGVVSILGVGIYAMGIVKEDPTAQFLGLMLMGIGLSIMGGAIGSIATAGMEAGTIGITMGSALQTLGTGVSLVGQAFLTNGFEYIVTGNMMALDYKRNLVDAAIFFAGGVFMGAATSQAALKFMYEKGATRLVSSVVKFNAVTDSKLITTYTRTQTMYSFTTAGEWIGGFGLGNLSFGFGFMPALNVLRHEVNPSDGSDRYVDGVSWVFDPFSLARGSSMMGVNKGFEKHTRRFLEAPLQNMFMHTFESLSKRVGLLTRNDKIWGDLWAK